MSAYQSRHRPVSDPLLWDIRRLLAGAQKEYDLREVRSEVRQKIEAEVQSLAEVSSSLVV